MIKCNVTICGVVSKAATCRTTQDGRPYVCFAMNVVIPAKTGIRSATSGDACQSKNKTVEVSVIKDGTLTEVGNPPVGSRIEVAGILTLKKRGDNLYFNLSATGINPDTTATEDSITGQMEFRGKTGKQIEEKTDKKGKPFLSFSAFSAEKTQDGFEYVWVRFIRFDHEREAWLQPGTKISAKGELDVSVYNDRLNFSCKVSEISEYIPQPYNP